MTNILRLPIERNLEFLGQQDKREFWLMCINGQPAARQKHILMEARAIGFLSDQDTRTFIDACGLRSS
ncbi:MAG: hypothetical protein ACJAU6_003859 [Alphaproteobacteria bacterium]|jgi:hypothetical protein